MAPISMPPRQLLTALGVLAAFCGMYIVAHFLRVTNAVIAPDLMREFSLSAAQMGVLTGGFFAAAALSQLPIGMLVDRLGARITIPGLMIAAVLGCGWFASAESMFGLTAGRLLMGVGTSGVIIGAMVIYTRWFPPQYFATLMASMIAVGNVGNILATTPLAAAVEWVGWRSTFLAITVFALGASLIGYIVIRDAPPGHAYHDRRIESLGEVFRGVGEALRSRYVALLMPINFISYACMLTILGLWGGPYLHDVHGLGAVDRGNLLFVMSLALIAGNVVIGPLDRLFDTRKWVALTGGAATVVVLALLALVPQPPLWLVTALFALLAAFNGFGIVAFAHCRTIFPDLLVGRGLTVFSFAAIGGIAVMQIACGWIVGAFAQPDGLAGEAGYRLMFAFIAVIVAVSLVLYARVPDAKPSRDRIAA